MYAVGEFLRLFEIRQFAFHPQHVRIRCISNRSVDRTSAPTLVPVESFSCPWGVPVPMDVHPCQALGDSAGFAVALAFDEGVVFLDQARFVDVDASVDLVDDGIVEKLQAGLCDPLVFDGLQFRAVFAGLLGGHHQVAERLERWIRHAEDEGMISRVNCGSDQGGSFRVGTGNSKQIRSHDVCLRTDSNQTIDMLTDRYEHFPSHMPAFLGPWCLVLDMNSSCPLLNKQLRKLHDCSEAPMAGVCVGYDGTEIVHICNATTMRFGGGDALLPLFTVMKELGEEQLLHFVGHSVHRIVCKIRRGFVGRGGRGGALPARDVDRVKIFRHLGKHSGFKAAVCEGSLAILGEIVSTG